MGSNSNVAEHGMDEEAGRAAIWEIDRKSGGHRIFATGLRNPNGLGWEPKSGILWTVVNERDELGSDLVPDYLTSVQSGGFYGWPYSYYGATRRHARASRRGRIWSRRRSSRTTRWGITSHRLALSFRKVLLFRLATAPSSVNTAHGTVVRRAATTWYSFRSATASPRVQPLEVLSGFLSAEGDAYGRPVGVAIDRRGALLVADDVGNTIWRVSALR